MTFSDGGLTDANERDVVASLLSQIIDVSLPHRHHRAPSVADV